MYCAQIIIMIMLFHSIVRSCYKGVRGQCFVETQVPSCHDMFSSFTGIPSSLGALDIFYDIALQCKYKSLYGNAVIRLEIGLRVQVHVLAQPKTNK